MPLEAFESVKGQVGGCGIWCGSCALGNGSLRALIEGLETVLDSHGAEHWTPAEMDYGTFARGLESLKSAASCAGCRKNGGRDDCPLRSCSVERGLEDCADCPDFGSCENDELLQHMRTGAVEAGLFVRGPGQDRTELLDGWTVHLRTSWPSSILFTEGP